jgi:phosphoenolpyruvate synthase/pyruvate phosphate dikinase
VDISPQTYTHSLAINSLNQAGGKGVNLGEKVHAGYQVLPGLVVTTAVCDHCAAQFGLGEIVYRSLSKAESWIEHPLSPLRFSYPCGGRRKHPYERHQ